MKFLGLLECVGSGGGIDDEKREVWRGFVLFGERAADFPEFLHQIVAGVDAAGGVADEELGLVGNRLLVRVETHRGGIGIRVAADDGNAEAVAPALELLDGGGAEGVGGREADREAAVLEPEAEFCGGGGFSCTIDADDENDEGFAIRAGQGWWEIDGKPLGEVPAGGFHDVFGGYLATEAAEFVDDLCGHVDAEVGADEIGLEVVPIDFRAVRDFME